MFLSYSCDDVRTLLLQMVFQLAANFPQGTPNIQTQAIRPEARNRIDSVPARFTMVPTLPAADHEITTLPITQPPDNGWRTKSRAAYFRGIRPLPLQSNHKYVGNLLGYHPVLELLSQGTE